MFKGVKKSLIWLFVLGLLKLVRLFFVRVMWCRVGVRLVMVLIVIWWCLSGKEIWVIRLDIGFLVGVYN